MSDKPKKERGGQLRLPKRTVSAAEEMSVDTRVAAQAIINDNEIGMASRHQESEGQNSRFVDWVLQYRMRLTIGAFILLIVIVLLSVFSVVNERSQQATLQATLQALTEDFLESGGSEMASWIESNDVRSIDTRFKEHRGEIVESLVASGFTIKSEDLKLRRDGRSGLVLGAIVELNDQEKTLVWGTPLADRQALSPDDNATQVFMDQWDSLVFIALMVAIFIAFIWLAPGFFMRQKKGTTR